MDIYEKQIADILPPCTKCNTIKVAIDKVTNKSILVGCNCGWGGLNPKEWKKEHSLHNKMTFTEVPGYPGLPLVKFGG